MSRCTWSKQSANSINFNFIVHSSIIFSHHRVCPEQNTQSFHIHKYILKHQHHPQHEPLNHHHYSSMKFDTLINQTCIHIHISLTSSLVVIIIIMSFAYEEVIFMLHKYHSICEAFIFIYMSIKWNFISTLNVSVFLWFLCFYCYFNSVIYIQ